MSFYFTFTILDNLLKQVPVGIEWMIILIVAVLLIFGAKKIPEIARGFGKASTEFERARLEARRELHNIKKLGVTSDLTISRDKLESVANTLGIKYVDKDDDSLRQAIDDELSKPF
jgi:sec-independent protein translocase protein TatA